MEILNYNNFYQENNESEKKAKRYEANKRYYEKIKKR